MSKKTNKFAVAIETAGANREAEIIAAAAQVNAFFQSVDRAKLNEPGQQELDTTAQTLTQTVQEFQRSNAARYAEATEKIAALKKLNLIRVLVLVGSLVLGVVLLFLVWWLGLILIIGGVITAMVMKGNVVKQAEQLAQGAHASAEHTLTQIGHPDTEASAASGLCARIDALYLGTLDQNTLALENQRRATNRQMAQMKAQHDAQMAQQQQMLQQQQAAMEAVVAESQATNDALYGKPGIIGTAIRTRDKMKRQQ